jgi:hypothetical protein
MATDPAVEAAAAAMFESAHARTGTADDSSEWTWEMAVPDAKEYYRGLARIALVAAYEAEADRLVQQPFPGVECRCSVNHLRKRVAVLRAGT